MHPRFATALSLLAVTGFLAWMGWSVDEIPDGADGAREAAVVAPCAVPVAWRLADVDPRFGVSREWVVGAVREAARVWGDVRSVPLLVEEDDRGLGVRLVFDERQALLAAEPPARFEAAFYREVVSGSGPGGDLRFREIRVFAFRDRVDLVRILAHEFGHVLGLAHSADSGALMFAEHYGERSSAPALELHPSDRRALAALCSTPVASPATR